LPKNKELNLSSQDELKASLKDDFLEKKMALEAKATAVDVTSCSL
jgi:hypothetical protein